MTVEPYLYLEGRAEEALTYYQQTLGAQCMALMRYEEAPDDNWKQLIPSHNKDKIMHSALSIGGSTLLISDGMCSGNGDKLEGFALTLSSNSTAETEAHFHALAQHGKVLMPLSPTFFAHLFGMVADPFGIHWMLITPAEATHQPNVTQAGPYSRPQ
jgi:PhnB protein